MGSSVAPGLPSINRYILRERIIWRVNQKAHALAARNGRKEVTMEDLLASAHELDRERGSMPMSRFSEACVRVRKGHATHVGRHSPVKHSPVRQSQRDIDW